MMEVSSARSKLDGVLQTLVEKTDEGNLSPEKDVPIIRSETEDDSPVSTPTKKILASVGKIVRKRKRGREEPITDISQYHHSYIMKLFDRSVDLAQFSEDTPLYPVCRAWIRNKPHGTAAIVPKTATDSEDERPVGSNDINAMSVPLPFKSEDGRFVDLRIPSPLPQPDDHLDIHADQNQAPAPERLFVDHMARWKQVRQKWKIASAMNELRDAENMRLLKEMFEKHYQDQ